ncbi:unnamed protein product [Ectocarpus sp. 6 AP-2014]
MPAKKKRSEEHKAKIAARKLRSCPKTPDIWNGCIASQLREDLKGKVSYMRINGQGPVEPVADMETLERMARLLQTDEGRKLFQQN